MITCCTVPEIWCAIDGWTDRRTDGRKKWHVEVGVPPKKVMNSYQEKLLNYRQKDNSNFIGPST